MSKNQISVNAFPEHMKNYENIKYKQEYNELKDLVGNKYKPNDGTSLWHDHKTIYKRIEELLILHSDKKFYLTYEIDNDVGLYSVIHGTKNWNIHDEKEIKNIIPENVNENRFCYSNGKRPFDGIEYPDKYMKVCFGFIYDTCYCHIEHLAYSCKNLYYVHPGLLECVLNE